MNRDIPLVIFTDVDGSLVDHDTYSHQAAVDALQELRRKNAPLVLCSSKTRLELTELQLRLGLDHPFICEDGGGVCVPRGYFPFETPGACRRDGYDVVALGGPYGDVVAALRRAAQAVGASVIGFADMTAEEIAEDCGLSPHAAYLAKRREYDEPFRVTNGPPRARERLHQALRNADLRVTTGGRYDHVRRDADKGLATGWLCALFRQALGDLLIVGLGDGLNDVSMLEWVDVPVVVRSPAPVRTAAVSARVPHARVTAGVGPAGWRQAVVEILEEREAASRSAPYLGDGWSCVRDL